MHLFSTKKQALFGHLFHTAKQLFIFFCKFFINLFCSFKNSLYICKVKQKY